MTEAEQKKMAVYGEEIAPLIRQANELALKNGIDFLAAASFDGGKYVVHSATIFDEMNAPQLFTAMAITKVSPDLAKTLFKPR